LKLRPFNSYVLSQYSHTEVSHGTGSCHAHMLLYVSGFNCNANSNYTKYLAQLCCRFLCVLENFHRIFANLVAPATDRTTNRLVRCKAHPVS